MEREVIFQDLYISFMVPCKETLHANSKHRAHTKTEKQDTPRDPLKQFLRPPVDKPSSSFNKLGPWKEIPISRAFSPYLPGSPARESSLQVPFTKLSQKERLLLQSPFQPSFKVPGR